MPKETEEPEPEDKMQSKNTLIGKESAIVDTEVSEAFGIRRVSVPNITLTSSDGQEEKGSISSVEEDKIESKREELLKIEELQIEDVEANDAPKETSETESEAKQPSPIIKEQSQPVSDHNQQSRGATPNMFLKIAEQQYESRPTHIDGEVQQVKLKSSMKNYKEEKDSLTVMFSNTDLDAIVTKKVSLSKISSFERDKKPMF